jgi:hypothetical protein
MNCNHSKKILLRFIHDLNKYGIYALPCGGGVIAEPRQAIYLLKDTYGHEGLRHLCLDVVRCTVSGEDLTLQEGLWCTVTGILYHLAEVNVSQELVFIYRQQSKLNEQSPCKFNADMLGSIEFLISCICRRLGLLLPEGIPDVAHEDEVSYFWSDEPPVSLFVCLLVLIIMLLRVCLLPVQKVWKWITL